MNNVKYFIKLGRFLRLV